MTSYLFVSVVIPWYVCVFLSKNVWLQNLITVFCMFVICSHLQSAFSKLSLLITNFTTKYFPQLLVYQSKQLLNPALAFFSFSFQNNRTNSNNATSVRELPPPLHLFAFLLLFCCCYRLHPRFPTVPKHPCPATPYDLTTNVHTFLGRFSARATERAHTGVWNYRSSHNTK